MLVKWDGRNKIKQYYYQCSNHKNKTCKTKSINAKYIERAILDIVISTIKNSYLTDELNEAIKERKTLIEAIISKNQSRVTACTKQLDSYVAKSLNLDAPDYLLKQYEIRIRDIAKDIESYNKLIQEQTSELNQYDSISNINVTVDELLENRIVARGIIRNVVKAIVYDEETGNFEIELI